MLRSIWTKTLREYRVPILGWGLGLAILIYSQIYAVGQLSLQARQDAAQLAESMRFFGDPVALTTPTGYVTWKTMGALPALLGIWVVLAGARLFRREEQRHSLDVLLATPCSRSGRESSSPGHCPGCHRDPDQAERNGRRIIDGPRWGASLVMTVHALAVLALGVLGFTRADMQRGQ
jgi:hypothetical protein